ncbi:Uncharacterized protein SCF082_LOCUS26522 [Durusdinium trenchii]|uniref:Uncharacterized protein n=1 Tax=Durusdinium trenchii TaxID=1381693 RepID=A0ABP0M737_9DINO
MGANSSVSNGGPAITEEQWGRMQEVWSKICTNEQFKPKCIIQYGEVDRVVGSNAFVKIADEVFVMLEKANAIWCFVPDEHLSRAKVMVRASMNTAQIA